MAKKGLTHSTAYTSYPLGRGKAPLRVNLEQAPAFGPRRVEGLTRGVFITFEGPEGCGKSVQAKLLSRHLRRKGYRCVSTREPGGTPMGESVRKVFLAADRRNSIGAIAELLLVEACRAELVRELIVPALKKGAIVICDRFSDSTVAYQGYGGGLSLSMIRKIDTVATQGLTPDVTVLLTIDVGLGLKRATMTKKDRMESKGIAYHRRVKAGFLTLARHHPRFKVIRVMDTIEKTQRKIRAVIDAHLASGRTRLRPPPLAAKLRRGFRFADVQREISRKEAREASTGRAHGI